MYAVLGGKQFKVVLGLGLTQKEALSNTLEIKGELPESLAIYPVRERAYNFIKKLEYQVNWHEHLLIDENGYVDIVDELFD